MFTNQKIHTTLSPQECYLRFDNIDQNAFKKLLDQKLIIAKPGFFPAIARFFGLRSGYQPAFNLTYFQENFEASQKLLSGEMTIKRKNWLGFTREYALREQLSSKDLTDLILSGAECFDSCKNNAFLKRQLEGADLLRLANAGDPFNAWIKEDSLLIKKRDAHLRKMLKDIEKMNEKEPLVINQKLIDKLKNQGYIDFIRYKCGLKLNLEPLTRNILYCFFEKITDSNHVSLSDQSAHYSLLQELFNNLNTRKFLIRWKDDYSRLFKNIISRLIHFDENYVGEKSPSLLKKMIKAKPAKMLEWIRVNFKDIITKEENTIQDESTLNLLIIIFKQLLKYVAQYPSAIAIHEPDEVREYCIPGNGEDIPEIRETRRVLRRDEHDSFENMLFGEYLKHFTQLPINIRNQLYEALEKQFPNEQRILSFLKKGMDNDASPSHHPAVSFCGSKATLFESGEKGKEKENNPKPTWELLERNLNSLPRDFDALHLLESSNEVPTKLSAAFKEWFVFSQEHLDLSKKPIIVMDSLHAPRGSYGTLRTVSHYYSGPYSPDNQLFKQYLKYFAQLPEEIRYELYSQLLRDSSHESRNEKKDFILNALHERLTDFTFNSKSKNKRI